MGARFEGNVGGRAGSSTSGLPDGLPFSVGTPADGGCRVRDHPALFDDYAADGGIREMCGLQTWQIC